MSIFKSGTKTVLLAIILFAWILVPASFAIAQEATDVPAEPAAGEVVPVDPASSEAEPGAEEPPAEPTDEPTVEPTVEPTATLEPAVQKQVNLQAGVAVGKVAPISLTETDLAFAENYSSLEEVVYLRSENPYRPDTTKLIKFSLSGAEKLIIRFESDFYLEPGYDIFGIYVYDAATNDYRLVDQKTYSGTDLAGQTVEIDSDTVIFRFESDGDVEASGWRVAGIDAELPAETAAVSAEPVSSDETGETTVPTETDAAAETESPALTATPEIEATPTSVGTVEIPTVTSTPVATYPASYVTDEYRLYGHESSGLVDFGEGEPRNLGAPRITRIWRHDEFDPESGASYSALKFQWTQVSGATGYRVWISKSGPSSGFGNVHNFGPGINVVTFVPVSKDITYYFKVAALKNGTVGAISNVVGGRINIGRPTLNAPTKVTNAQIRLSWSAVPGATGYRIWRSDTSAGAGYGWTATVGNTTSVVSSIPSSTKTYYYKVAAIVANMTGTPSLPKSYRATLPQPKIQSIKRVTGSTLRITWTAVPGATGYRLWRSDTSATSGYGWVANVGNTTTVVTSVPTSKTYFYRVAALSGATVGTLSAPVAGTTAMARPVMKPVTNLSGGVFRLSWNSVPGADSYILYRSEVGASSGYGFAVNVGKKTTIDSTAPNIYKRYYYKVAGVFNGQVGPTSNVVSGMHNATAFRALTIGEGAYLDGDALYGTVGDSVQVANAFRQFRLNGAGFQSVQQYSNLTKPQILAQIQASFAGADSNDVSLFYFSGHGTIDNGIGYLYTVDRGYISARELRIALDSIPGTKYVLIDACYSGSFIGKSAVQTTNLDPAASADEFTSAFTGEFVVSAKRIDQPGYFVLTAAHSSELSWEYRINGIPVGLFTNFLLQGIGWSHTGGYALGSLYADANRNRIVTFTEAYNYSYGNVISVRPDQSVQIYPAGTSQVLFAR